MVWPQEESQNLESYSEKANGRKIVVSEEDINYHDQERYSDYDKCMKDTANVVKLNRHPKVDG